MSIVLDARLTAAAKLVDEDAYLCDVGTDHAYLPCALMLSGKIKGGMAMDINTMPLENANRTIAEYQLGKHIVTRLSDGLDALTDEEKERITDVAICGMGGELIGALISRADWLKNAEKSFILQPMTQIALLRERLYEAGYSIEREIPVVDKNHLYTVMKVRYCGESKKIGELFSQVGKIPQSGEPQTAEYLNIVSGRLKKAAMGMLQSDAQRAQGEHILALAEDILRLSPLMQTVTVGDIYALMDEWAPFDSQCVWDHSGLQTGNMEKRISGAVVALDCTDDVIDFAVKSGADLIITHHPLIFKPLDAVLDGSLVAKLVQNGIALICAHTNLDKAKDGVNDCLADALSLSGCAVFGEDDLGRVGFLPHSMSADEFAEYVKTRLHTAVTYWAGERSVTKVALVGGAGSDLALDAVKVGTDAYLTGELKHNFFVDLAYSGMTFAAAGHYATERAVLGQIRERIIKRFPSVGVQIYELKQLRSIG